MVTYCNRNNITIPDGILNTQPNTNPIADADTNSNSNPKSSRKRPMSDITNTSTNNTNPNATNRRLTPPGNTNSDTNTTKKTPTSVVSHTDTPPNDRDNNTNTSKKSKIQVKNEPTGGRTSGSGMGGGTMTATSRMNLYSDCVVDLSQGSDSDADDVVIIE